MEFDKQQDAIKALVADVHKREEVCFLNTPRVEDLGPATQARRADGLEHQMCLQAAGSPLSSSSCPAEMQGSPM